MKVYAFESEEWAEAASHGLTKDASITTIENALDEISKLLPTMSKHVNVVIRPHFLHVIPEYGTGGYTHDSEFIEIAFDKTVPYGVEKTLKSFHQTIFHEGNHTARYNDTEFDGSILNSVITEGLATGFERDYAHFEPLYGLYESDEIMTKWLAELQAADWSGRDDLFFNHPDGRRWVGYKTGTWLIDKAIKSSGKSIIELTGMPANEIVTLAKLGETE